MKTYKNFLFDLDGTIILDFWEQYRNKLNEWFKDYLINNFSDKVDEEKSKNVYSILAKFIYKNECATKTKEEITSEYLANELNLSLEEIKEMFSQISIECKSWTKEMFNVKLAQGVIDAIKYLNKKQCRVFLATNTYFSKGMILNRLEWSGLKEEDFEFVIDWSCTGYAKPSKEYFEYFIERFNLDSNQTLMIGNSLLHDSGSESAEIDFYLIENCVEFPELERKISYRGNDKEFYAFIQKLDLD